MENSTNLYRLLVVDDEEDICEILQYNLKQAGYYVDTALSAEEALYKLKNHYHLLLLDIMLGGINGYKLAQLLREEYDNNIPIIFISALNTESDVVAGFAKGGDDYISKPFSVKEVIARVGAVLARTYGHHIDAAAKKGAEQSSDDNAGEVFEYKNLHINYPEKSIHIDGREVQFTKKEYEIVELFSKNPNKLFSREEILKFVWKDESCVLDRTIDVHIARVRKKLGIYGELIVNRSGYGYSMHI